MFKDKAAKIFIHWLVVAALLANLTYGAKVYSESEAVSEENDPHANLDLFVFTTSFQHLPRTCQSHTCTCSKRPAVLSVLSQCAIFPDAFE